VQQWPTNTKWKLSTFEVGLSNFIGINCLKRLIMDLDFPSPSPRRGCTASPTTGVVENLNTSFLGSFHVDESLKALNPWEANTSNEVWDF